MGFSRRTRGAATAMLALALWMGSPAASQPHTQEWYSLELPGSPSALASAVGLDPETPRARLLLEVIRVVHPTLPGRSAEGDQARARLQQWLSSARPGAGASGEASGNSPAAAPAASDRQVPSPLDEGAWRRLLGGRVAPGGVAATILADRPASLLYYGLMALDAETRDYLAANAGLLQQLYIHHAGTFATLGRSLRVHDRRVIVPGGADAVRLWEALVDAKTTEPGEFVLAALSRKQGRVALFIDTVAHLDPARQLFALSAFEPDPEVRLDRVRRLLRTFTDLHVDWRVNERPFARPVLDAPLVLLSVSVHPDGRLVEPASQKFWESVFSGRVRLEAPPDPELRATVESSPRADAAWLVEQVVIPDLALGRARLGAVSFVQRLFHDTVAAQLLDTAYVARAFIELRTAVVSLERLGATDVRQFHAMAEEAARLTAIGDEGRRARALAQLQGGLVLLERLRSREVLSSESALDLARQLFDTMSADTPARVSGARWMRERLLPALGLTVGPGPQGERDLLGAVAGRGRRTGEGLDHAPAAHVMWEGLEYEVDIPGAELARLERVRQRQHGNRIGDALALANEVVALESAATVAAAHDACARLSHVASSLERVSWPGPGMNAPLASPGDLVGPPCARVGELRGDGDLRKGSLTDARDAVAAVADAVLGDTLVALVYALHVGDPAGALELAPDIARRHDFGFSSTTASGAEKQRRPWALPEEQLGAGTAWHVTGSLLGLEHGLAKLALQFLFGQQLPAAPRINENERRTLALGLALLNPSALRDSDRDAIVGALARGRTGLASVDAVRAELPHVAQVAGWSEWRMATVSWALDHDPESLSTLLTLADYFWAGLPQADPPVRLDAWGNATTSLDGDLRLEWPGARPWEELAGRAANGQLATRFVDLTLRVAEALAEHRLPASLTASALAPALADLIHEAPLGHADDWYALATFARRLSPERLLDYIASLAAGGPLIPVDEGDGMKRPGQ